MVRGLNPGSWPGEAYYVDDSGGGPYGLDAEGTFTAEGAGMHRIIVGTSDGYTTGYLFTVTSA